MAGYGSGRSPAHALQTTRLNAPRPVTSSHGPPRAPRCCRLPPTSSPWPPTTAGGAGAATPTAATPPAPGCIAVAGAGETATTADNAQSQPHAETARDLLQGVCARVCVCALACLCVRMSARLCVRMPACLCVCMPVCLCVYSIVSLPTQIHQEMEKLHLHHSTVVPPRAEATPTLNDVPDDGSGSKAGEACLGDGSLGVVYKHLYHNTQHQSPHPQVLTREKVLNWHLLCRCLQVVLKRRPQVVLKWRPQGRLSMIPTPLCSCTCSAALQGRG